MGSVFSASPPSASSATCILCKDTFNIHSIRNIFLHLREDHNIKISNIEVDKLTTISSTESQNQERPALLQNAVPNSLLLFKCSTCGNLFCTYMHNKLETKTTEEEVKGMQEEFL